jgi:hypothetical protein
MHADAELNTHPTQGRLISWALGSSIWTFVTPAVYCSSAGAYAAVVRPSEAAAASPAELWTWPQDASGAVSLERGSSKVQLPAGQIHTLHAVSTGKDALTMSCLHITVGKASTWSGLPCIWEHKTEHASQSSI